MPVVFSDSRPASSFESDMDGPAFRIRVPASTSNCGPGFDTLGLAFNLYNEVLLKRREDTAICYVGQDARFQNREQAMIEEVSSAFFVRTGLTPFGFSFDISGDVPLARGLGSSVTVRAGILGGLNAAAGTLLGKHEIAAMVTDLEGHPDNAVAAVFGGFCVARSDPSTGRFVDVIRFDVPADVMFAVLSPDLEIETHISRQSLPEELSFSEVVKSLNSLAFLVSVFATGDYEKLRGAVTDFIHQPYRLPHIPGAAAAIEAGVEAGGYAGWLSGSGSSLLCVCRADVADLTVAAMAAVLEDSGVSFRQSLLRCDNEGLRVSRQ